jgi:hypothetical protein
LATVQGISRLQRRLQRLGEADDTYWSFKDDSERDLAHSMFQYPAMMVPHMQRILIEELLGAEPLAWSIYDPFVGSGTVLTEAMLAGLEFVGLDINPLAILISRTKAGPFHFESFREAATTVVASARGDHSVRIEASFLGIEKWFTRNVARELSALRRAIASQPELSVRRFLWVALAETVRLTSNSRTSTVKLHLRDSQDLLRRSSLSAIDTFARISSANADRIQDQANVLTERRLIDDGHYKRRIIIRTGDARHPPLPGAQTVDFVLTSPPYGDNQTTVAYGQHSYLPLQWIDLPDIQEDLSYDCLCSTHEIDFHSLGGSNKNALARANLLTERSPTLRSTLKTLDSPTDGAKRVGSFIADLDTSLEPTLRQLRRSGLMIWIVGNRRVNGHVIPTTTILTELLADRAELLAEIERPIQNKRHAHRNSIASTMTHEAVLVYRKLRNGT